MLTINIHKGSTFAVLISLELFLQFQFSSCKIIPTKPPCSQFDRKAVVSCRNDERQKLMQQLSSKITLFVDGIFIGKLLTICNSAESYPRCVKKINQTLCHFQDTLNDIDFDVLAILNLCRYKYIYEEYDGLKTCLFTYSPHIKPCYETNGPEIMRHTALSTSKQYILQSTACRPYYKLYNCIVAQAGRFCPSYPAHFIGALVDAGISYSQICRLNNTLQQSQGFKSAPSIEGTGARNSGVTLLELATHARITVWMFLSAMLASIYIS